MHTQCTVQTCDLQRWASEDAQRHAMCEGVGACGNAETTNGCTIHEDADTCTGECCEVGTERYEQGDSPARPERAAMCSNHRRGRHDPQLSLTRSAHVRVLPALPRYHFLTTVWMPGWQQSPRSPLPGFQSVEILVVGVQCYWICSGTVCSLTNRVFILDLSDI